MERGAIFDGGGEDTARASVLTGVLTLFSFLGGERGVIDRTVTLGGEGGDLARTAGTLGGGIEEARVLFAEADEIRVVGSVDTRDGLGLASAL